MTAVYELEVPKVSRPYLDPVQEEKVISSYCENDWLNYFKDCQFIDYRQGRQTDSVYMKDLGGHYQVLIFNKMDSKNCTFIGSVGEVQINTTFDKQIFDKMVNYVKYGEMNVKNTSSYFRV